MGKIRKSTLQEYQLKVSPLDLGLWLKEKYLYDKLSFRQIMKLLDTKNNRIIKKLLDYYDIPIRYGSEAVATQWIDNDKRRKGQSDFLRSVSKGNTNNRLSFTEIKNRYKEKGMTVLKREIRNSNKTGINSHRTWVLYQCDDCNNIQWQMLGNFEDRCPKCCIVSKGEIAILKCLNKMSLKYIEQYSIKECRNKEPLPFDFALFNGKELIALIEYQGEQHYKPVDFFGGEKQLIKQQKHDNIKRTYCKSHNIPLIEIPYWEEDIEMSLEERLKELNKPIQLSILI